MKAERISSQQNCTIRKAKCFRLKRNETYKNLDLQKEMRSTENDKCINIKEYDFSLLIFLKKTVDLSKQK